MSGLIPSGEKTWAEWNEDLVLTPEEGEGGGDPGDVDSVNGRSGVVTLTKEDVGLGAVNNTSDATKNAATVTLTNKTLASPAITGTPTGISKTHVGLGNVDNTSNATERAAAATLMNKTLASPTITGTPSGITKAHVGLGNVDNTSDATLLATERSATATLTNKTLTAPVVNSPTGIVKADVGLGNVDNTSDASKNAASATLTNKTLTSPAITSPTGIVKGDVGLGNVDNTSNATERAAVATLTNKTLNSPTINTPSGIVKNDVGLGSVTNDAQVKAADVDTTVTLGTSDTKVPSQKAVKTYADTKVAASAIDTDATFAADSDTKVPSQKAVKTAIASAVFESGGPVTSVNSRTGAVTLAKSDVGLSNVDNTSNATERAATATLTNKTITSPAITTPTGIVKGDVGLGNVDNTSDSSKATTEATAVRTLTNKTLTSPAITSPTGIVKADVGLGNVDNTSNATERAATATLTNKTLASPAITGTPTGITATHVGLGSVSNTSDATKNSAVATLTNKTLTSPVITTPSGLVIGDVGITDADDIPFTPSGPITATSVNDAIIEAATLPASGGGTDLATLKRFSTLAGATDSAKLAKFCTDYAAATSKPTLILDELRDYTFASSQLLFQGFAMIGGGLRAQDQARSGGGTVVTQKIRPRLSSGTGWLTFANGTTFGISISGLSIDATAAVANRMFAPNASAVPWTMNLRDISYQNGPGIMGSPSVKQPVDVLVTSGFWNINNITDATNGTAWNLGGSDNTLGGDKMLIDTQTTLMAASGALVRLSGLSKTEVHGFYLTAEEHRAMVISGTNWMLHLHHNYIEGRHADQPSLGALIQISSDVTISDSWFAYAMSAPSSASGGETGNRGVLHQSGGVAIYSNLTYAPADGVANTVPIIYVTGSGTRAFISNIVGKTDAGTYFKPVVRVLNGATVVTDSSVTVVNV